MNYRELARQEVEKEIINELHDNLPGLRRVIKSSLERYMLDKNMIPSDSVIEEHVSESFVKLFEQYDQTIEACFTKQLPIKAILCRLARISFLEELRSNRRKTFRYTINLDECPEGYLLGEQKEYNNIIVYLMLEQSGLSEQDIQIVTLLMDGHSYVEIAEKTNITRQTISKRLKKQIPNALRKTLQ